MIGLCRTARVATTGNFRKCPATRKPQDAGRATVLRRVKGKALRAAQERALDPPCARRPMGGVETPGVSLYFFDRASGGSNSGLMF